MCPSKENEWYRLIWNSWKALLSNKGQWLTSRTLCFKCKHVGFPVPFDRTFHCEKVPFIISSLRWYPFTDAWVKVQCKAFHACLIMVMTLFIKACVLLNAGGYIWTMLGWIERPDGYRQSTGIGWRFLGPVFPQINLRTHLLSAAGWVKTQPSSCPPHWADCSELTLSIWPQ